jgi:hypothetical protein
MPNRARDKKWNRKRDVKNKVSGTFMLSFESVPVGNRPQFFLDAKQENHGSWCIHFFHGTMIFGYEKVVERSLKGCDLGCDSNEMPSSFPKIDFCNYPF